MSARGLKRQSNRLHLDVLHVLRVSSTGLPGLQDQHPTPGSDLQQSKVLVQMRGFMRVYLSRHLPSLIASCGPPATFAVHHAFLVSGRLASARHLAQLVWHLASKATLMLHPCLIGVTSRTGAHGLCLDCVLGGSTIAQTPLPLPLRFDDLGPEQQPRVHG